MAHSHPAPRCSLFAPQPTREETSQAACNLSETLDAAGLRRLSPIVEVANDGVAYIGLNGIPAADAVELARLVRKGMRGTFKLAEGLRKVFLSHGLDVPDVEVDEGRIALGEVSVPTAARLAILLGAPRDQIEVDTDASECAARWAHQVRVRDLLSDAYKNTTGNVLFDVYAHPDCIRCNHEPSILLGKVDIDSARQLLATLRPTVP
ncbi:hypothetical protein [Streptomyces sp. NEAU-S7GS2]|uniref:hypothetical protein n=1 Tax=Streptomyces sp. NEAU-S7GS2 TaxID=2202000 RepID=UPI000D6EDBFB|nr:hypothetical protein [Streptomyces sp. NEAU-S7GS2]AWN24819.1 hypothetical protein DKG71_00270 [Streptomyces sp. NEAU-S7GS2]